MKINNTTNCPTVVGSKQCGVTVTGTATQDTSTRKLLKKRAIFFKLSRLHKIRSEVYRHDTRTNAIDSYYN